VVFLSIDSDCNRLTQCLLIEFLSDSFQSNLLRTLHDGDAFSDATVMLGRQVCVPLYHPSRANEVYKKQGAACAHVESIPVLYTILFNLF